MTRLTGVTGVTGVKKLTGVKELTGVTRETSVTGASKEGEGGGNAVTAGIINPESPVNHWRHMGAIAWTKLIYNIKSAQRQNHLIL